MTGKTRPVQAWTFRTADASTAESLDTVAVEEPLELRVAGRSIWVTMRNPGNDFELALGWLWTEGLIRASTDVRTMRYCDGTPRVPASPADQRSTLDDPSRFSVLNITPRVGSVLETFVATFDGRPQNFATGACGICAHSAIDQLLSTRSVDPSPLRKRLRRSALVAAVERLGQPQRVFSATGGTHSAAIADIDGKLLVVREDTGRHNALDKVLGWAVRNDAMPLHDRMLVVSSRAGFELAQKTAMTGAAALISFSAPSSSAIDAAAAGDFALVSFASPQRFVVYEGLDRFGD